MTTIYPVGAPDRVPAKVTRRQALQALRLRGITEADIEAKIAGIENVLQRDLALIEFRSSLEFERHRPLVIQIGKALELTDADMDQLFIIAATL